MDTHESAHRPVETYVKISLDFFGAMKRVTFDQCNQNDLLHFFAAALHGLPPLDKWSVNRDPYIEPDHPEWFEDDEAQPIRLTSDAYHFHQGIWKTSLENLFETPALRRSSPRLYCEVNNSTHLQIKVSHHVTEGGMAVPFDHSTSKNLAMVTIAFEAEIDKLLADHVGYINHSASARSNAENINIRSLSMKAKLERVWKGCGRTRDTVALMCPEDPVIRNAIWRRLYKYNFVPLLDERNPYIEFRQHHGTLNATEISYWITFVGSLVELAGRIDPDDLLRLVHMKDMADVNMMELFMMMACAANSKPELDMMQHYCRKIMGRGGNLRVASKLRLRQKEAGARALTWKELKATEVIEEGQKLALIVSSVIRSR